MNHTQPSTQTESSAPIKKRVRKVLDHARVSIRANYNNTIVTLTDMEGKVLAWSSPGSNGYKGSRQSTPYAGQVAAEKLAEKAASFGVKTVDVSIKGMGPGRDQTVRGLINGGLMLTSLIDRSRLPHGGCRHQRIRKI